jgi:sugar-specific transcriptional regulator TrmB
MDWLKSLGLNEKEQKLYVYLLEKGALTAAQLAEQLNEQRTNVYLIAEKLIAVGLVVRDESQAVAQFKVSNPENLQELMMARQKAVAGHAAAMKKALPEMLGLYHLNTSYEGLAYFEGLKGYTAALEDMVRSSEEVLVFASSDISQARPDAWVVLQKMLDKRALAKVKTRMIFELGQKLEINIEQQKRRRIETKFWGNSIYEGEIALYGSTVVLTTYDDKLISLVIKNKALATTFKSIFETAWTQV